MAGSTTNYGLSLPEVNSPTDEDLWGDELNDEVISPVDSLMASAIRWEKSNQTTTFSVTAPTSASSDIGDSKKLFLCNATSASLIASLPAASDAGDGFTAAFKKTDNSTNTVTIEADGSELIDGSNTVVLSGQYDWLVISCDGTKWNILSSTTPDIPNATTTVAGIVKLATSAEVVTGTEATKAVTPASLVGSNTIGASLSYTYAGGYTHKAGSVTGISIPHTGTYSFSYPAAFPTATIAVIITPITANPNDGILAPQVISSDASGFVVQSFDPGGSSLTAFYWSADGY